jgi:hypothetical protein
MNVIAPAVEQRDAPVAEVVRRERGDAGRCARASQRSPEPLARPLGGMPWARIGELIGHDDLVTTARTYTHVVADERELDYAELLA